MPSFISVLLAFTVAVPVLAQQAGSEPTPEPTLDEVLTAVYNNLQNYISSVPNLLVDEHVVSSVTGKAVVSTVSTTNSIFRLRRVDTIFGVTSLVETRDIKDGQARGNGQSLSGPSIVNGIFSSGTSDLSLDLKRCYDYRLETNRQLHRKAVLIVNYTGKTMPPTDAECPVTEPVNGRAFIDPSTMQVVRAEQTLPKHELNPGIRGSWTWSVDYTPVTLNNKIFWLPETITSESSTIDSGGIQWSFVATYRNYHLLTVSSKILPSGDSIEPKE